MATGQGAAAQAGTGQFAAGGAGWLAGALVLAAAAGARRSEAALPRFLAANRTMDAAVLVLPDGPLDDLAQARRRLAALPEVQQVFRLTGALILAGVDPTDPGRWHRQLGAVALDPSGSLAFGRPIVVASHSGWAPGGWP